MIAWDGRTDPPPTPPDPATAVREALARLRETITACTGGDPG